MPSGFGLGGANPSAGLLPTLGLTQYKNTDLATNQRNPFSVQSNTEKLLVVREREREFKDFNKLEKEG